ncbi:hypothetical protein PI125_g11715 [Phytophthora idaei]|nr:hypothetical protein PI125_g11715 [Phytophthora idaei]
MDEEGLEQAFFSLKLTQIPSGFWDFVDVLHPLQSSAKQCTTTECVTELVDTCWALAAANFFHGVCGDGESHI